jgi:hypothetical protein
MAVGLLRDHNGKINVGGGRKLPPGWTLIARRRDVSDKTEAAAKALGIVTETAVTYLPRQLGSGQSKRMKFETNVVGYLVPSDRAEEVAALALTFDRKGETPRAVLQSVRRMQQLTHEQRVALDNLISSFPPE